MPVVDKNIDKEPKWYVLKTFNGYENVAKDNLQQTVEKYELQNRIFDIVIPMEDVLEEKRGKKVLVPRKMMPGYIIVKMMYGDDIWPQLQEHNTSVLLLGQKEDQCVSLMTKLLA